VEGEPDGAAATRLRAQHPDLINAQLAPAPPIFAGRLAALAGATAMLDLSDGLALDARRMASASNVVIDLHSAEVGSREALDGGEDHSLLAAFPPDVALPTEFRAIGTVVAHQHAAQSHAAQSPAAQSPIARLLVDGQPYDALGGWDPYSGWNGEVG
jgi:thiamine-monophosphate kinase